MEEDKEVLLSALEAHGRQFLESFALPPSIGKRKASDIAKHVTKHKRTKIKDSDSEEFDEWSGLDKNETEDEESEDKSQQSHSKETLQNSKVIVFSDIHPKAGPSTAKSNKTQMKAFMSSKVTKLTMDIQPHSLDKEADGTDDEELTNAQNDALLHRLVHTKILSGSLDHELDLTRAQRRKALAGRVLEAAGKTKLGKGESAVRADERNRAAKKVRDGMEQKRKERSQKELEEAKQLGNYHPALKQLFEASGSQPQNKKREKGLKMGVGSFKDGILQLRKTDIDLMHGHTEHGRGGRGRGRGRGKGRGRGSSRGGKR